MPESGEIVAPEGEALTLLINALALYPGEEIDVNITVHPDYQAELKTSPPQVSLPADGEFTVEARLDRIPEPRETVQFLLSGTPTHSSRLVSRTVNVIIPRHGYAVTTMMVSASPDYPSDEFVMNMGLNGAAPSTVQVTVNAFVRDTDTVAGTAVVLIHKGATTASGKISLRVVSTYTLSITDALFTYSAPQDQTALEVNVESYAVSVHHLLIFDDLESVPHAGHTTNFLTYFFPDPLNFSNPSTRSVDVSSSPCTGARDALTLEDRLPCLDVTGDGFTDGTDAVMTYHYLDFYDSINRRPRNKRLILFDTTFEGRPNEVDIDEIIRRIQRLYPRTQEVCDAFNIDCD